MRTIVVLMWKHALVRRRKFILTIADLVVPILLFIFLFVIKDELTEPEISGNILDRIADVNTPKSGTVRLSGTIPNDLEAPIRGAIILYHPETPFTNALMVAVGEKLFIKPLKHFPVKKTLPYTNGYFPFTNNTQFLSFKKMMRFGDAIIIFHNFDGDAWPTTLNYTIRMIEDFHYRPFKFKDDIMRFHKNKEGQQHLTFMRLQWAIDHSYISTRSGSNLNQTVSLQEFPYFRAKGKLALLNSILFMFTWLSLMFTFVILVARLGGERNSGVPELIKMEGVKPSTLALSHYLNVLPAGIVFSVFGTVVLKSSENLFPNTGGFFLLLMFLLYYSSIIAVAFACSYVVNSPEYAITLAVVTYFGLNILSGIILSKTIPDGLKTVVGLIPQVPLSWYLSELCLYEEKGSGISLDNMSTANDGNLHASVLHCYILLVAQTVLFFCLAWYLSLVRPGKYGQAKPWHLNVKNPFAKKGPVEPVTRAKNESATASQDGNKYFEEPPEGLKVGVFIDNVTKKYAKHTALKNVTLKVFEGEITVLLGHNGAGKTTLMSVITGMTSPTTGRVFVYGLDTSKQQNQMRKHIGLCPQYNMFFPDLTLKEHIMFFTLLKGGKFKEARESSRKLAGKLGLEPKLNEMWTSLSGGMQRRAQLACALAGDASVLVLDEPTAGLDVETRRGLWDLLLSLRGAHTVLLSTHFMEEADALGDRVVALNGGELRCFATNMFLKRAIGDGYRLTLTTLHQPKEQALTQKVQETVPDATVKERTIGSISYNLPANSSTSFPKLFLSLEDNKAELEIDSIGVGVSTLEEVFLKLCSNVNAIQDLDERRSSVSQIKKSSGQVNSQDYNPEKYYKDLEGESHKKLIGPRLYGRQFSALLKRQISFILYRKWVFLILQVILPVVAMLGITNQSNNQGDPEATRSLPLNLDMYADIPSKRILCNLQLNESYTPLLRTLDAIYPVEFHVTNDDVSNTVLRIGKKSVSDYTKYLSGIEINDTDAQVLYTRTVHHIAPVTLNIMSNLLGMRYLNRSNYHILTQSHPIRSTVKRPKDLAGAKIWAAWVTFLIEVAIVHCVALPAREQITGSRNVHIMSGCSIKLYWLTTLLFHMAITVLFLIVPAVMAAAILEEDSTIDQADFLFAAMTILFIGALALLAVMYWITMNSKERNPIVIIITSVFMLGLIFPMMKSVTDSVEGEETQNVTETESDGFRNFLETLHYVATPYTISVGMLSAVKIATENAVVGATAKSYFSLDNDSPFVTVVILLVHFIFFMGLVLMMQRGMIGSLCDHLKNRKYKPPEITETNVTVNKEHAYVEQEITKSPPDIELDAILVHEVHKNYRTCRRKCNAVKGLSFSVKKGECFGLLGVNGAGKSSTFKMLTAEECTTRGKIYGNGYFLKGANTTKYLQTLGYCPQYLGLDLFLTGNQNLTLLLTLRGLEDETIKKEVKSWIKLVDLEKYAERRLESYSGGCMRRLGAAGSLCGGAAVTLLDEPSAGVDVAARRQLWTALRKGLRHYRSIIITSHSMDEMEALCDRISIMCAGRIRALGSPAGLRAEHAAGHAVRFKIKHTGTTDNANEVIALKTKIKDKFDCVLKDEHKTMLHYHINTTMHYSELFQALEALKNQFSGLIEDYTVTETTLEEVFLALAEQYKVTRPAAV